MFREQIVALGDQGQSQPSQAHGPSHRLDTEAIAAHPVGHNHIEGCGRRPFFIISAHPALRPVRYQCLTQCPSMYQGSFFDQLVAITIKSYHIRLTEHISGFEVLTEEQDACLYTLYMLQWGG